MTKKDEDAILCGISRLHASWLSPSEIAKLTGLKIEEAKSLKDKIKIFVSLYPLRCSWGIKVLDDKAPLVYGVHLLIGEAERFVARIKPKILWVPEFTDEKYINYLIYDLPKKIEENVDNRRPVATYIEAFTHDIETGIRYALWTLARIGITYRIPCLALGTHHCLKFKDYLTGAVEFVRTAQGTEARIYLPEPDFIIIR